MTIVRWAALTLFAAVLVLVLPGQPASAHAALLLTVNTDGRGSVSVDAKWADGHPVTGPMAATMIATAVGGQDAAGQQVGPVALTRLPGSPTVVFADTLAPGQWQVTVDIALPGVGHCATAVRVVPDGAAPAPSSTRCGAPEPAAAPPAQRSGWPVLPVAAAIVLGGGLVALLVVLLRRFRFAGPPSPPMAMAGTAHHLVRLETRTPALHTAATGRAARGRAARSMATMRGHAARGETVRPRGRR